MPFEGGQSRLKVKSAPGTGSKHHVQRIWRRGDRPQRALQAESTVPYDGPEERKNIEL